MSAPKGYKPPAAGKGRPPGAVNKTTALLKDAILQAADEAHKDGLVGYLKDQALENPGPFMSLLGKVLPLHVDAKVKGKLIVVVDAGS